MISLCSCSNGVALFVLMGALMWTMNISWLTCRMMPVSEMSCASCWSRLWNDMACSGRDWKRLVTMMNVVRSAWRTAMSPAKLGLWSKPAWGWISWACSGYACTGPLVAARWVLVPREDRRERSVDVRQVSELEGSWNDVAPKKGRLTNSTSSRWIKNFQMSDFLSLRIDYATISRHADDRLSSHHRRVSCSSWNTVISLQIG